MVSLITGVGGFAGQHLAAHLLRNGEAVYGIARQSVSWHASGVLDHERFNLITADLSSAGETRKAVEVASPDRVYHLAAMTNPQDSFGDPIGTISGNVVLTVNLLEEIRRVARGAAVLIVSSSEVYGRTRGVSRVDERAELRPENPYGVSKAVTDLLGYQYHAAHGVRVVRVRPFNHIGPGQSDRYVASSFARQIAEIELGQRAPVIEVGNLDARRDFTDVRDVVAGYEQALLCGEPGAVYNLGSGTIVTIRDLLDALRARTAAAVEVRVAGDRLRPADDRVLVCDATRLRALTGWAPHIPLATTLDDTLGYWRRVLRV